MTQDMVARVASNMQSPNFVAPADDSEIGWSLFFAGYGIHVCMNDAQRASRRLARQESRADLAYARTAEDMHGRGPAIEDDYAWIRTGC